MYVGHCATLDRENGRQTVGNRRLKKKDSLMICAVKLYSGETDLIPIFAIKLLSST